MTILHSKNNQPGDSDDPPPKKKSKKSKPLIRSQTQTHATSHPTTSTGAGASHLPEQIGLYSFLSSPQSYYSSTESQHYCETSYFGQSDQEILKFTLDKFDVGIYRSDNEDDYSFDDFSENYQDQSQPGTSRQVDKCKSNKIYNPDSLEYYIYGPGSKSPNSKHLKYKTKHLLPDVDLIEVISSEDIEDKKTIVEENKFDSGSLLDDINNFDIDDKFGEIERFQQEAIWENSKMYHLERSLEAGVMLNGYDKSSSPDHHHHQYENRLLRTSPAASLSNLGNTCFLNSVLYTLRFAPNFLHNLHHLVSNMNSNNNNNGCQIKQKTSSLGRNMSLNWTNNNNNNNNENLNNLQSPVKTKKQIVTEKLHEVYEAMHNAEMKEHIDPFHPDVFLTALREVNPIFEGNQQQDAHELLVCLLDIFRETCQASARQAESRAALEMANYNVSQVGSGDGDNENNVLSPGAGFNKSSWSNVMAVRHSLKVRTQDVLKSRKNDSNNPVKKKNKREIDNNEHNGTIESNKLTIDQAQLQQQSNRGGAVSVGGGIVVDNFVAQDFEGVMVLKTTCLECENTTEKREPFADICVPIKTDVSEENGGDGGQTTCDHPVNGLVCASEQYQRAVVTDEFLRDRNKYYCEECLRYNEARRSVRYQTLPRLLTLQLKRFSSTYGAMSKVTQFMPTPMNLSCFCEECRCKSAHHSYQLYGVIMHLGPNMAGGHYIAYVKTTDNLQHYMTCTRDMIRKTSGSLTSDTTTTSTGNKTNNKLYNFFKTKSSSTSSSSHTNDTLTTNVLNNQTLPRVCRSLDCCGVKNKLGESLVNSELIKDVNENVWIACDDDNVKLLTGSELELLLSKNSTSNATPYLLFYSRTD